MINLPTRKSSPRNETVNWLSTLWREWRFCHDREYAEYLFGLLVNQPLSRTVQVYLISLISLAGGLVGGLSTFLFTSSTGWVWGGFIGGIIGAILGVKVLNRLRSTGQLVWGTWLKTFIPSDPPLGHYPEKTWKAIGVIGLVGLASGLGVGWTGIILFNQTLPHLLGQTFLVAIIGVILLLFKTQRWWGAGLVVSISLMGLIFGLTFGLGFAQLAGLTLGPLNATASARVTGLAVGVGVGLWLGHRSGLMGMLLFLSAVIWITWGQTGDTLFAWLVGLLNGGLLGSFSHLWFPSNKQLTFAHAYTYRWAYFWWPQRPFASRVEVALSAQDGWNNLLQRLVDERHHPEPPEYYLTHLQDADWQIRFLARHMLVSAGTAALPTLQQAIQSGNLSRSFSQIARWIVHSIGWNTRQQLGHRLNQMICMHCLTACKMQMIMFVQYCGCRLCREDQKLFYCPAGVVAVLDHTWKEPHKHQDSLLEVNWVIRGNLFDFDRVRIVRATDEEVERLAVQIGNDTDPVRRRRYSGMVCTIEAGCHLSENTLRILQRTFGQVEFISSEGDLPATGQAVGVSVQG